MSTTFPSADELRKAVGMHLGPSRPIEVPQARINAFGDATEDRQWIHIDAARAALGPFGATIAHGLLTLSLVPAILEDLVHVEGVAMAINYGFNRVRFPSPVRVGTTLHGELEVAAVDEVPGAWQAQYNITIAAPDTTKPACFAECIVRYVTSAKAGSAPN